MVLDAGQYGFVKLQYYKHPFGFDETGICPFLLCDAHGVFFCLCAVHDFQMGDCILQKVQFQVTPLADLDYQDMFRCLPEEQQKEILGKRKYFLGLSRISL